MANLNKPETRNLLIYFVIAYAFSWVFWIPEAMVMRGMLGPSAFVDFILGPHNPAAYGPFVAAFSLTYMNGGVGDVIKLLKRAVDLNFAKVWLIPTFLIFPLINGGALLLAKLSGETIPELPWLTDPSLIVVTFVVILFTGGPLQEEFGWRGYALPRLQSRLSALVSSVMLGAMWTFWHLPYYFIGGEFYANIQLILPNLFSTILITILITWLYNNTGGSIFVTLMAHNMFNVSSILFPALATQAGSLFFLIFIIATVVAVVRIWGPKRLAREPKD